jgi:hypothetical protein
MRIQLNRLARTLVGVAGVTLGVAVALLQSTDARAQCKGGEYALQQSGLVGWVYVNSERTIEWWAYLDEVYEWADTTSVGGNAWHLQAEYIGTGGWSSYAEWRSDVLQRSAAQGRTVVFQQHAVNAETVSN